MSCSAPFRRHLRRKTPANRLVVSLGNNARVSRKMSTMCVAVASHSPLAIGSPASTSASSVRSVCKYTPNCWSRACSRLTRSETTLARSSFVRGRAEIGAGCKEFKLMPLRSSAPLRGRPCGLLIEPSSLITSPSEISPRALRAAMTTRERQDQQSSLMRYV